MTQDAVAADAVPSNALRVRSFRYLWLNSITFALVMNATRFVYGWVVLDGLNRSESQQGLVVFLLGIPTLVLVLPAGVWADRLDRRWLLLGTQAGVVEFHVGCRQLPVEGDQRAPLGHGGTHACVDQFLDRLDGFAVALVEEFAGVGAGGSVGRGRRPPPSRTPCSA